MIRFLIVLNIIFIFAFIVLLTGYIILARKDPSKRKHDRDLLIGFLVAILCGTSFGIAMFEYERNTEYEKVVYKIHSLDFRDNEFYLGTTENENKYIFYIEVDFEKVDFQRLKIKDTYIDSLEYSIYKVPTWTKKKEKGNSREYNVLYLPDNYVILPF